MQRYRQWCRSFPAAGAAVGVEVTHASALHVLADVDFREEDGRLLARLEDCESAIDPTLRRAFHRNQLAPALG